jgi:hypothetical protein
MRSCIHRLPNMGDRFSTRAKICRKRELRDRPRVAQMKRVVEYWRWAFRDPATDQLCRTSFQLTAEEAERYLPEAERIPDSLTVFEIEGDGEIDTVPDALSFRWEE